MTAIDCFNISLGDQDRSLHRNFQGYTTKGGCDVYGFGVSAISALEDTYAQNWRDLPGYYKAIDNLQWPTMRGVRVSANDKLRRTVINRLLCNLVLIKAEVEQDIGLCFDEYFRDEMNALKELEQDHLVKVSQDQIEVTELGRIFVRNVAMVFDSYLRQSGSNQEQRFPRLYESCTEKPLGHLGIVAHVMVGFSVVVET